MRASPSPPFRRAVGRDGGTRRRHGTDGVASGRSWRTGPLRDDLLTELRRKRWVAVGEVRLRDRHPARADVLALRRGGGEGGAGVLRVFELKVSRGDLLADLRRGKWRAYLDVAPVVFALPEGLATAAEIPARAGLIVRGARGWRWVRPPAAGPRRPPPADVMRRLAVAAADQAAARASTRLPRAALPLALLGLLALSTLVDPSRIGHGVRSAAPSNATTRVDRAAGRPGLGGRETKRAPAPRLAPALSRSVPAARAGLLAWMAHVKGGVDPIMAIARHGRLWIDAVARQALGTIEARTHAVRETIRSKVARVLERTR